MRKRSVFLACLYTLHIPYHLKLELFPSMTVIENTVHTCLAKMIEVDEH